MRDDMNFSDEVILKVEGLKKSFGNKKVLDYMNFEVKKGKIVGFLGPNGCGKSTTVKIINGLTTADGGNIYIDGNKIGVESKKIISYLPERTYLNDWMKVRDIIDFFDDLYEDFDKEKAFIMFSDLGIDLGAKLKTLSKGTKEKVQLALVMSRNAKLYILDEPIAGVDPAARSYIMKTILTNIPDDSTLLIVTHLINDIETICDEVIFVKDGKVLLQEDADKLREKYGKSIDSIFREEYKC